MAKVKIVEYIGEVMREIHFDEFADFLQYEFRDEPIPTPDIKPLTKLEAGKVYRVIGNSNGHEFKIGEVIRLTSSFDFEEEYRAEHLDGRDYWYVVAEDLEEI